MSTHHCSEKVGASQRSNAAKQPHNGRKVTHYYIYCQIFLYKKYDEKNRNTPHMIQIYIRNDTSHSCITLTINGLPFSDISRKRGVSDSECGIKTYQGKGRYIQILTDEIKTQVARVTLVFWRRRLIASLNCHKSRPFCAS